MGSLATSSRLGFALGQTVSTLPTKVVSSPTSPAKVRVVASLRSAFRIDHMHGRADVYADIEWSLLAPPGTKDGLYNLPSNTAIRVVATDDLVASKIWIKTPVSLVPHVQIC